MAIWIATSAVLLAVLVVYLVLIARRQLNIRAEAALRRRLVERQERLAELRVQQAMQRTVQQLFEVVRGDHS